MHESSIIQEHIEAYDYRAALDVANNVKNYIDENAIALMEAGSARLKLDKSIVRKKQKLQITIFIQSSRVIIGTSLNTL